MAARRAPALQWPAGPRLRLGALTEVRPERWLLLFAGVLASAAMGGLAAVWPALAAIAILGGPAVALALAPRARYPALLAILVLMPLAPYLRVFTGIRSGPAVLDIAFLILVSSLFADRLLARNLTLRRVHLAVAAFVALGLAQLFNPSSPGLREGLEGFRILALPALAFFAGYWVIDSNVRLRWAMLTVAGVATVVALYGVKQGLSPNHLDYTVVETTIGSPITYTSLGRFRAFSTLSSPAHLSFLMNATILLLFSLLASRSIRFGQFAGGMAASGAALMLTIVRVGWIGTGAGLVVLLAATPRFLRFSSAARLVMIAAVTVGLVTYLLLALRPDDAISARFRSLANLPQEKHYIDRVTSWQDTIVPAITAQPLGYGMGSDGVGQRALFFSHNGYFYIAIEMGVVGAALAGGILIWALCCASRGPTAGVSEDPALLALRLWILSWTAALLVMGTFGALLEVYPVNLYYWCFVGALAGLTASSPRRPLGEESTR